MDGPLMLSQSTFWFGCSLVLFGAFGLALLAVVVWRRG